MNTLRLILADQLNVNHSWLQENDHNVLYLIAELRQETDYVQHHGQKVLAFFAAMQAFARQLDDKGHRVKHLNLDATCEYGDIGDLLAAVCAEHKIDRFEYQLPDEYRLRAQLRGLVLDGVEIEAVESEHFLLKDAEIADHFKADKAMRMEGFYRNMRKRFGLLMDGDGPTGGKWNFDQDNRHKLKAADIEEVPAPLEFENDVAEIRARLRAHGVAYFGSADDTLGWAVTREQSLELLEYFCCYCLPRFGKFQDAMTAEGPHAWSLYHSRLSFSLNSKLLGALEVVERAIKESQQRPDEISLAQIEGFVRQIIGWREFVRGIYWINMPEYGQRNALNAQRDLPDFLWTGNTRMRCMQHSIGQSLEHAYAHHIQRLMVIGNFCLLAGIDPSQVDAWYLGVYIDAIEWVEMPNTRGMSQFADDGLIASKPYTASGAYINRMSDYCRGCHYKVKEKVGDDACPFNSLYWHFMHRHQDKFGSNPRIGMVYRNLNKMDAQLREQTLERGDWILNNLNTL